MNERGVEVLVSAAMRGVKQIKGSLAHNDARCGHGVLREALGFDLSERLRQIEPEYLSAYGFDLSTERVCAECGEVLANEVGYLTHLNDEHDYDFLALARKLGPDA